MLECSLLRKERPTVIQNLPLTYDNEISHKHSGSHQIHHCHIPNAARPTTTKPDSITTDVTTVLQRNTPTIIKKKLHNEELNDL